MSTFPHRVRFGLVLALGSLLSHTPLPAEDDRATAMLDAAAAKMSAYQTWSADYVQTMNIKGQEMTMRGQIKFRLPAEMRVEMELPMMGHAGSSLMVLGRDGVLWQDMIVGGQRRVIKMDMNAVAEQLGPQAAPLARNPADQMDPRAQLQELQRNFDLTVLPATELHGQVMQVLEGVWKESVLTNQQNIAASKMFRRLRMYLGQEDGFVHKTEMYPPEGEQPGLAQEFQNLKFNEDFADALFTYTVPDGVQVMDMSEMMKNAHGGMGAHPAPAAPAEKPAPAEPPAVEP